MNLLKAVATLGILAVAVSTCQAAEKPNPERPNVLWIMLDDCRAGALSCYGEPWADTPNMDAVAERGVLFETAIVQNMVCSPSRNSFLTGQYCHQLHHMAMGWKPPAEPPRYLPEDETDIQIDFPASLRSVGMQPLNVGKRWNKKWWVDIPFEKPPKFDPPGEGARHYPEVNLPDHGWRIGGTTTTPAKDLKPARLTDAALRKLDDLTGSPKSWFLRVSYSAPHVPIVCPPEYMIDPESVRLPYPSEEELAGRPQFVADQLSQYSGTLELTRDQIQIARGTYYGMVRMVDDYVGRLVKKLEDEGQLENTLIVITGDHGLQMGEHGMHKKRNFYEQTVKVPFIISLPSRLPKGKVIREQVETIDMMPTLLELIGADYPKEIPGNSLMPLIDGKTDSWRPVVFSEIDHARSFYPELRVNSGRRIMVRTKDWKMIYFRDSRVEDPDGALYDLKNEPNETRNLFEDEAYADVREELASMVDRWDSGHYWRPDLQTQ